MNVDIYNYLRRRPLGIDSLETAPTTATDDNELPEVDLTDGANAGPEIDLTEPAKPATQKTQQPMPTKEETPEPQVSSQAQSGIRYAPLVQRPGSASSPTSSGDADEQQKQLWAYLQRQMAQEEANNSPEARENRRIGNMLLIGAGKAPAFELDPRSTVSPQVLEYLKYRDSKHARTAEQAAMDRARLEEELAKKETRAAAAERQAREDAYRREHDAAVLAQQAKNAEATRALASAGLGLRVDEARVKAEERAAGKDLPASTVTDLADVPVAVAQLERLKKDFSDLGMEDTQGRIKSVLTNLTGAGWTDAAKYNSAAMLAMQGVGKIMEGGKLAAGDEVKYKSMLPRAGDSKEVAAKKTDEAAQFLMSLVNDRLNVLKAAGYKVTPEMRQAVAPHKAPVASENERVVAGKRMKKGPNGWEVVTDGAQ